MPPPEAGRLDLVDTGAVPKRAPDLQLEFRMRSRCGPCKLTASHRGRTERNSAVAVPTGVDIRSSRTPDWLEYLSI